MGGRREETYQVAVEDVVRIVQVGLNGLGPFVQGRAPLAGVPTNKAAEVLEAQARGPQVKGPGHAALPIGHVVLCGWVGG